MQSNDPTKFRVECGDEATFKAVSRVLSVGSASVMSSTKWNWTFIVGPLRPKLLVKVEDAGGTVSPLA